MIVLSTVDLGIAHRTGVIYSLDCRRKSLVRQQRRIAPKRFAAIAITNIPTNCNAVLQEVFDTCACTSKHPAASSLGRKRNALSAVSKGHDGLQLLHTHRNPNVVVFLGLFNQPMIN